MKTIKNFILGVILFIVAIILFIPLSVINFIVVAFKGKAEKYFLSSAINLDRFGNYEFRSLFNITLRRPSGYEFGDFRETISSVLGKNQRDGTLTTTGRVLAWFLDVLDKNHCKKSIREL